MRKLLLLLSLAALLTGCEHIDQALLTEQVTVDPQTGVTQTNLVANPVATGATEVINLAPFPYAGLVSTLAAGALGLYAQIRNRKHQALLSKEQQVVEAIIGGVELANTPSVKDAIRKSAAARGVGNDLHNRVKRLGG